MPFDCMRAWFEACIENHRAINAITGENGDPYFTKRLMNRLVRQMSLMMKDDRLTPGQMLDYVCDAMASMCVGLMLHISQDAANNCEVDPMALAGMVNLIRVAYHNDVASTPSISSERLYGESAGSELWKH